MTKAGKMAAVIARIAGEAVAALKIPGYFLFLFAMMYSAGVYYSEKGEYVTCEGMTDDWSVGVVNSTLLEPAGLTPDHTLVYGFCRLYDSDNKESWSYNATLMQYYTTIFDKNASNYYCNPITTTCCFCIPDGNYLTVRAAT
eukprot:SAG11_NODE_1170_length_5614_cov_4.941795_2_plen_142_part_00